MKPTRILIALLFLLLPLAARTLWFYQGIYRRAAPVATPDYAALAIPRPQIATPAVHAAVKTEGAPVVLFDMTHSNSFTLSEIETLTRSLTERGAQVELTDYTQLLSQQLKTADSYVIIAPTVQFSPAEILAVSHFVQNGGRLLAIADPTRNYTLSYYYGYYASSMTSVDILNQVLAPYRITFSDDYLYNLVENEGNFRNVITRQLTKAPLTEKLNELVFYSAHSLKTDQLSLIGGGSNTRSSLTDQSGSLTIAASAREGQILALGDLTFMTLPYIQVADNHQLTLNIANFLSDGSRPHDLQDFPYLFSRPVTILAGSNKPLDKDQINFLSKVQRSLSATNVSIDLADKPLPGNDLLVIGTYDQKEKLAEFLAPFDLQFPGAMPAENSELSATPTPYPDDTSGAYSGDTIGVPGFGRLALDGVGLLLYDARPERNTLILLAKTFEAINGLADLFSIADLSGCTVQQRIAVCPVYEGDDLTGADLYDYDYDYSDGLSPTGVFTPTPYEPDGIPTPVGSR